MAFVKGFLGACLGLIVAILVIVAYIYIKVRKLIGPKKIKQLKKAAQIAKEAEVNIPTEYYDKPKTVGGITKLIEPEIIRDFGDFNKDFLFSKVESNLRKILTALEEKTVLKMNHDQDLIYIRNQLEEQIRDMSDQCINVKYDDIVFHEHAIKSYNKSKGRATITVSSSLEYYYSSNHRNFRTDKYKDKKKQTRYTTKFVYVYDESAFDYDATVFSLTCPNCGAGAEFLGAGNCKYCGTYIEPINLKNWFMVSYKEDYKN